MTQGELLLFLLGGALVTLHVTVLTAPLVVFVAFAVGLARLSRWDLLRFIASVYVEVFRGTSVLVQLYIFFFVFPPLLGIKLTPVQTAVLGLGLNFGAYASEIVRSAILSIGKGQWEAAAALNMPRWLTMRKVIVPQALRRMVPPFGNYGVQLFKATSITSLVQVQELTFRGYIAIHTTFETVKILLFVASIYFVMIFLSLRGVIWLERRLALGTTGARL